MAEKNNFSWSNLSTSSLIMFSSMGAILILLAIMIGFSGQTNLLLGKKMVASQEAARPAKIDLTILTADECRECYDIKPIIAEIKKYNIAVTEKIVTAGSEEGKDLIKQYGITKAPSLIATGELEKDAGLNTVLAKIGQIKNNTFILTAVGAPYIVTSTGEVKGKVQLTEITDGQCQECYQVAVHEAILKNYGFPTSDKKMIDINSAEGKNLRTKYKITMVPTIILSGEVGEYQAIKSVWPQVGTVEADGAYVFRAGVPQMGAYKDLMSGKMVKPVAASSNAAAAGNSQ